MEKWKTFPIGREIRPELWGQIFDDRPAHSPAQDFAESVRQIHVTWLMDTGMFRERQSPVRIRNAVRRPQRMGYEFHIERVDFKPLATVGPPCRFTFATRESPRSTIPGKWS